MTKDIVISRTKFLFIVFGLLIMWGLALHQYLLFLRAYASPQKAVALYIDVYHEADPEIPRAGRLNRKETLNRRPPRKRGLSSLFLSFCSVSQ